LFWFTCESIERDPPPVPADLPKGGSIKETLSLPSLELGGFALPTAILKLALERLFCDLEDLKLAPIEVSRLILSGPELSVKGGIIFAFLGSGDSYLSIIF